MKKLFIELADTPIKREYGLMDRKKLSKNEGMLFRFSNPEHLSFWMKNTYIPLSIAFIDDDGKVMQINDMVPLSTKAIVSKNRCRYALEVNRGWFKENGINIGSYIKGEGIKEKYQKSAQMLPTDSITQQSLPNPDLILNKSNKEKLEEANLKSKNMVVIYQTRDGLTLPPKSISPPFTFEEDKEGKRDAIVKVWDNQDASWKSFLIDNILSIEEEK